MQESSIQSVCWPAAGAVLLLLFAGVMPADAQTADATPREQIGMILGTPVYRDQTDDQSVVTLFLMPLVQQYRKEHHSEIEPTEAEIEAVAQFFATKHRERMEKQGPEFREQLQSVKEQEQKGRFEITDPKLRSALYHYWATQKHGAFLSDDKEQIRKTFIQPEWYSEVLRKP